MRFKRPKEGEWIQPTRNGYKLCCCDCGLVHRLDFRVRQRHVQFRVFREARSTGQVRRHMKKCYKDGYEYVVIPGASMQ